MLLPGFLLFGLILQPASFEPSVLGKGPPALSRPVFLSDLRRVRRSYCRLFEEVRNPLPAKCFPRPFGRKANLTGYKDPT